MQRQPFRKYASIVRELAMADFRLKYHDSALGYFWSMLNPLAMFVVYHFVFSYLFVVQVPKFTFYLLSGIVFWNFFADATLSGMHALESKASLAKKIYFPRAILLVASTLTALFSFVINTIILWVVVMFFDHAALTQVFILFPFFLCVILTMGVALLLGTLYIHFRDTMQIWSVCLSVGFWLTPIVYNALTVPLPLQTVALFNPLGRILVMVRAYLVFGDAPSAAFVFTTTVFSIGIAVLGFWLFQKHEYKVAEYL